MQQLPLHITVRSETRTDQQEKWNGMKSICTTGRIAQRIRGQNVNNVVTGDLCTCRVTKKLFEKGKNDFKWSTK